MRATVINNAAATSARDLSLLLEDFISCSLRMMFKI
jgi:hypothetical protein